MNEIKMSLRQIEESDLSAIQALSTNFHKVKRFPFSMSGIDSWLQKSRLAPNEAWFIINAAKEGGAAYIVGLCGLTEIDWVARHAKIFFAMMDKAKHKASIQDHPSTNASFGFLLRYGFEKLGLNKLAIEIVNNDASLGVLEKAGFVVDGVIQDAEFLDGQMRQAMSLSLMSAEYEKRCSE